MGIVRDMSVAIWNEDRLLAELQSIEDDENISLEEKEAKRLEWYNAIVETPDKIANVAGFLKSIEFRAKHLREEKREICDMYDTKINATERLFNDLKTKISDYMVGHKIDKIEAGVLSYSFRKSDQTIVTDETALPSEFMRVIPETKEPDKDAVKKSIKADPETFAEGDYLVSPNIPGAKVLVKQNLQIK